MYQMLFQLLLQLSLLSFAVAGDSVVTIQDNAWKYGTGGGVLGFAVLILDIIVFMEVLKSNRVASHKLLWCLIVFIFPILGLVIYWLFSNRAAHAPSHEYEAIP